MFQAIREFFGLGSRDESESPAPSARTRTRSTAFRIGEKLSIKGEIVGEGDLELAGRFEGTIHVQGTVVVGDHAEVDADITASTIVVGGRVRGNLSASGRVEILPQGTLTGSLRTGSFLAAEGASVKGDIVVVERGARPTLEVNEP